MPHPGAHDATLVALSVLIAARLDLTQPSIWSARVRAAPGSGRTGRGSQPLRWRWAAASGPCTSLRCSLNVPGIDVGYDSQPYPRLAGPTDRRDGTSASSWPTKSETGEPPIALSGLVMGLGIAGMHYTGMAAMRMPADLRYDQLWVAVSILIAIGAAIAALSLAVLQTQAFTSASSHRW